jgi:hypothetical protein
VPEDRFGDLGEGRAGRPRAGDRLADLDRTEPEPRPGQPRRREPGRSYMWVVGVAGVIAIAVAGINSLGNAGGGSHGPQVGRPLPRFAAPSATGSAPDADPNIKQSRNDNGAPNKTPACEVRVPGALRSCDYTSKPVVITFIVPGAPACEGFLDQIQRIQERYPKVNFLAVVSGAHRDRVQKLVADHGWTFPVFVDRNLAVFNTYRISLCATTVFAYRGGIVRATKVEAQRYTGAQLDAAIRATEAR